MSAANPYAPPSAPLAGGFTRFLSYGIAAAFAMRANLDYYKCQVLGDRGWL